MRKQGYKEGAGLGRRGTLNIQSSKEKGEPEVTKPRKEALLNKKVIPQKNCAQSVVVVGIG